MQQSSWCFSIKVHGYGIGSRAASVDRSVIIGAPFELSLSRNGRPVTLTAPMIHAFITTTVWTLQLHRTRLTLRSSQVSGKSCLELNHPAPSQDAAMCDKSTAVVQLSLHIWRLSLGDRCLFHWDLFH